MKNVFLRGLLFGLVVQLTISPIYHHAVQVTHYADIMQAILSIEGALIAEALFIALALLVVGKPTKRQTRQTYKWFGAGALVFFGLNFVMSAMGAPLVTASGLLLDAQSDNALLMGAIIVLSQPLTALFWAGVFSGLTAEHRLAAHQTARYGAGALFAMAAFLGIAVELTFIMGEALPRDLVELVSIGAGLIIAGAGIRLGMTSLEQEGGPVQDAPLDENRTL
jgi:hypothetical protein